MLAAGSKIFVSAVTVTAIKNLPATTVNQLTGLFFVAASSTQLAGFSSSPYYGGFSSTVKSWINTKGCQAGFLCPDNGGWTLVGSTGFCSCYMPPSNDSKLSFADAESYCSTNQARLVVCAIFLEIFTIFIT